MRYEEPHDDRFADSYTAAVESNGWLFPEVPQLSEQISPELKIRGADLFKLHELMTRLLPSSDLSPLFAEIVAAVTQLHGTEMGTLMLLDPDKSELYLAHSQGLPDAHVERFQRIPVGTGPCGIAVKTGCRVVVRDVANDERTARVRAAGGLELYQSLYSTPLITHSGKVIGSIANFFKCKYAPTSSEMLLVDLYARHAAEFIDNGRLAEEAERSRNALSRKAQELEHFVYSVAHDLKEPLRTISAFTDLLRRANRSLEPKSQEYMRFLSDGARRMTDLINDLVGYARLEASPLPFSPVDTAKLVENVLAFLQVSIREQNAKVTCEALPTIFAEEKQLGIVFQNLIANAIKFRRKEVAPEVVISAEETHEGWVFSVKDNGIGIHPDYQASLFQIFRRLNGADKFPGTGIGLASCKKIVDRHNGRIWIDSSLGQGSTFRFLVGNLN